MQINTRKRAANWPWDQHRQKR